MPSFGTIQLSDVADVISLISGIMTILGISGFITWGLFSEQRGNLADDAISVFALSLKAGICVLLLWPMAVLFFVLHIFVVLSMGPGAIDGGTMFWNAAYPVAYFVSYLVNTLVWVPLYAILCACVFAWSLKPFATFWAALRSRHLRAK